MARKDYRQALNLSSRKSRQRLSGIQSRFVFPGSRVKSGTTIWIARGDNVGRSYKNYVIPALSRDPQPDSIFICGTAPTRQPRRRPGWVPSRQARAGRRELGRTAAGAGRPVPRGTVPKGVRGASPVTPRSGAGGSGDWKSPGLKRGVWVPTSAKAMAGKPGLRLERQRYLMTF